MQFLRRIFFYVFSAIYIIVCPLIILYAFGYILKPGFQEGIVKTGLIYIATAPTGATVYLNGKKNTQSTPATLSQLTPGSYSVELDLKGYTKWQEALLVKPEKATVLDKVLLVPEKITTNKVIEGEYKSLIPMPKSGTIAVVKDKTLKGAKFFNYQSGESFSIVPVGSENEKLDRLSYFTQNKSPMILFELKDEQDKFIVFNASSQQTAPVDITELLPYAPETIKWAGSSTSFFSTQKNYLNKLDIENKALYPEIIKNLKGFGVDQNSIYVVKNDNTFSSFSYEGKNESTILKDPDIGKSVFGTSKNIDIDSLSEDLYVFTDEKGALMTNKLPYKFVDKGVKGYVFHEASNKLAVWGSGRVGILDFSTEKTENVSFQKPPELKWIYETGRDIAQAFWVYEGSHILFRDGQKIILLEMDEYNNVKVYDLFNVAAQTDIYYSEKKGIIFFLDEETKELSAFQLRPQQELIPLSFQQTKKGKKIEEQR